MKEVEVQVPQTMQRVLHWRDLWKCPSFWHQAFWHPFSQFLACAMWGSAGVVGVMQWCDRVAFTCFWWQKNAFQQKWAWRKGVFRRLPETPGYPTRHLWFQGKDHSIRSAGQFYFSPDAFSGPGERVITSSHTGSGRWGRLRWSGSQTDKTKTQTKNNGQ